MSQAAIPDVEVTNFPSVQGFGQTTYAAPDGSVYVGGIIGGVGGNSNYGDILIDTTSSNLELIDIPRIEHVNSRVPDGNGGWYIGGDFTEVGNVSMSNIVHILPNQTIDSNFNPGLNNYVTSLYFDETSNLLYVGGNFTSVNVNTTPITRNYFAAINGTTGIANGFNPDLNGSVSDIAFDDDNDLIYAVGSFSNVNVSTSNLFIQGAAAFNTVDGSATSFDPSIFGGAQYVELNTVTDTLYIGGVFNTVNQNTSPVSRFSIAGFNTTNASVTSFNPSIVDNVEHPAVRSIQVDELTNTVYVGGWFDTVNSDTTPTTRRNVAAFNGTTGAVTSFNPDIYVPNPENAISTIALDTNTNTLYVAGTFNRVNHNTTPVARLNSAGFSTTTSIATSYNPNASGGIDSLDLDIETGQLWASGKIYGTGGTSRNGVAHIFSDGTLDTVFNPDIDGLVTSFAIAESSNTIYVGGYFTTINVTSNPTNRYHLAALDLTTGAVKSFNAGIELESFGVRALAYDDTNNILFAAGTFNSVNVNSSPVTRLGLAAFNGTTGTATNFDPSPGPGVGDIAFDSTNHLLYASGYFTSVNNTAVTRNNIAAFDTNTTGAATSFNPDVNGGVLGIDLNADGSILFASGEFTSVNMSTTPVTRNNAAAFTTSNGTVTSFNPDINGAGVEVEFNTSDNSVFIGGMFTTINSGTTPINQFGLASFNPTTGVATSFRPNLVGIAFSFSLDEQANRLYASGLFGDPELVATSGALAVFGTPFEPNETNETTTTAVSTSTTTPNSVGDTQVSTTKAPGVINGISNPVKGFLPTTGSNSSEIFSFALILIIVGLSAYRLKTSKLWSMKRN